ncbi:MAG: acetylneuraminic acid synthetase, partial [Pseudomonadota bacterium]
MLIDQNFSRFVVFVEDSILIALNKISANKRGIVFAVTEGGLLEGVLSDGDLRRWLTTTGTIDLTLPVSRIMNRDFVSARIED